MNSIFYVVIALSVSAIVVTVYAFLSAPQGFEDEEGFHAIRKRTTPTATAHPAEDSSNAGVHPRFYPR
jgi:hypothetical protein